MDLEDLKAKADERTKAVILISPNNPTGHVASESEILALVDWANQKKLPLICDEVFSEFFYGDGKFPRPIAVAKPDLCFTLNGLSKMFALPALKLGWIAATGQKDALVAPAVDRLETIADTFLSVHIPVQKALPEIFAKGRPFVDGYVAEVGRRRKTAIDLLKTSKRIRFVEPVGGFYLMARIETDMPEEDFVVALMKETGVFVHPGYFFDYERGVNAVISYLVEPKKLTSGLEAMIRFSER
jgi:aspartate/methionine/tyrosine aminotransferase